MEADDLWFWRLTPNLTFTIDALDNFFRLCNKTSSWEQLIEVRAQIKALIHLLCMFEVVPLSSSSLRGWYKVQSSAVAGVTVMSPSLGFRANAERWPHSKLAVISWGFMEVSKDQWLNRIAVKHPYFMIQYIPVMYFPSDANVNWEYLLSLCISYDWVPAAPRAT